MLVAQAIDQAQIRTVPATEKVPRHDVFIDREILHRAVEVAVDLDQLEIAEVRAEEIRSRSIARNRTEVCEAVGLAKTDRVVERHRIVLVERDVLVEALVAPAALEPDLRGEFAIVCGEPAAEIELRGPFLVLCVRQRDEFDVVEFVFVRIVEQCCPRIDREQRDRRVRIVEADVEPVTVEVAFERDRVETAVLALARFRPAERVIGEPGTPVAFAASHDRADFLAFEAVLHVAFDREFLVTIVEGDLVAANRARTVVFEIAEVESEPAAVFLIVELAVDTAHVKFGAVAGAKIEAERAADAFALDVVVAIFHGGGEDRAARLDPVVGLDIVGFEGALVIAQPARDADIVTQPRGEIEAALGADFVGIVVVAAFQLHRQQAGLAVEGTGGLDLDRSADRVGIHVGGERLLHFDRFDDVRRDHVERDRPHIGFGRRQAHAVERGRHQVGRQPANRYEASLPLVVQHVDAGQATQAFGHVLVGELADRVAGQHVGNAVGFLLARQRARQIGRLADDEDLIVAEARHRNIGAHRAGRRNADRAGDGFGADIADFERIFAGRNIGQEERAVAFGGNDAIEFDDPDLRAAQCDRVARIGNGAFYGAGLRRRGKRERGQRGAGE